MDRRIERVTKLVLTNDNLEVELNKVETDDEKAGLWEMNEQHKGNSKVTFVMSNRLLPVDIVFAKETNELLLFNINLDDLPANTLLLVNYTIDDAELRTAINLDNIDRLEETFRLLGIDRVDKDRYSVFNTPTYLYRDETGNYGKVKLWLNAHGHRLNELHLSFV